MAEGTTRKRKVADYGKNSSSKSNWPLIKPKKNLEITRLKETDLFIGLLEWMHFMNSTLQILFSREINHKVQDFLTCGESKSFVKAAEATGFVHQGSLGPTKGEAYRDNDRISVNDSLLAKNVWESGLNNLFSDIKIRGKVAVGLNPNIRFYRYKVGQRFGQHIDESVDLGDGKRTHYTLLIYLSGDSKAKTKNDPNASKDFSPESLVGGETVFYGSRNRVVAEVVPTEGMALLHIHGDKCMLHESRIINKGVKYLFRSDVVFA